MAICRWEQNQLLFSGGEKSVMFPMDGFCSSLDNSDISLLSAVYFVCCNIATLKSESQSTKRCDLDNALFSTEDTNFSLWKTSRAINEYNALFCIEGTGLSLRNSERKEYLK